jgi:hypothetical protein
MFASGHDLTLAIILFMRNFEETRKLVARVEHLGGLVKLKRQQLDLLKQLLESDETLYRQGILSRVQLAGRQFEVAELSADLERLLAEQNETRLAAEKLRIEASVKQADFKELQRTFKESASTGEIRATALRSSLAGSDGDRRLLQDARPQQAADHFGAERRCGRIKARHRFPPSACRSPARPEIPCWHRGDAAIA